MGDLGGPPEEVTFELKLNGKKEIAMWRPGGKSNPGRGHSSCKGPGAAPCLMCWRNSQETRVSGAE